MTAPPLSGVRVLEVASHVFVPIAGSVLAEWGAEVIKVEHPETGDPYRGLVTAGLHKVYAGFDVNFQAANRSKRSVAIDLKRSEGRALLSRILAGVDVFTTNFRLEVRRSLRIDVDDIWAENPAVIYVRGSAFGARGPDAGRGSYDAGAYWARSGMQSVLTSAKETWPSPARPAFGDVVGGLAIAGAIGTALYRRAATGEPSLIDVSLLAAGIWQLQADVVSEGLDGEPPLPRRDRYEVANPLNLTYPTADGRHVALVMVTPDRRWQDLCRVLGHPETADDPRFVDMDARRRNARACIEWLESVFSQRNLAEWREILADLDGEWAPVQLPSEVHQDPQVMANGYVADVDMGEGVSLPLVTSPVQFDEQPGLPRRAPEHGEDTETMLLELGLSWDEITTLKQNRVII